MDLLVPRWIALHQSDSSDVSLSDTINSWINVDVQHALRFDLERSVTLLNC